MTEQLIKSLYLEEVPEFTKVLSFELRGGEVLALTGDLGAGKTFFTQELLKKLGVSVPVTSPTYTIAKSYQGVLPSTQKPVTIWHLDIYRTHSPAEVAELGIGGLGSGVVDDNTILIIEWAEKALETLPETSRFYKFLGLKGDDTHKE